MRNRRLLFYGLREGVDGVDAVDQRLIETDLRKIDVEFFLEEYHDLHGIHRCEASAEQQRSIIREWLLVALLQKQFLQVFANLFPVVHVFSSDRQIKKVREKSKMLRDGISPLGVIENVQ